MKGEFLCAFLTYKWVCRLTCITCSFVHGYGMGEMASFSADTLRDRQVHMQLLACVGNHHMCM